MRLRSSQLQRLQEAQAARFAERLAGYLRKAFPDRIASLAEDAVRAAVADGVERARGHGLESEREIAAFVDLQWRICLDFDRDPATGWAAEILGDATRSGSAKVAGLHQAALHHLARSGA